MSQDSRNNTLCLMCWEPHNETLSPLLRGRRSSPRPTNNTKDDLGRAPGFSICIGQKMCCCNFPPQKISKGWEEVIHRSLLEQTRWMNAFLNNEDKSHTVHHCMNIYFTCFSMFSSFKPEAETIRGKRVSERMFPLYVRWRRYETSVMLDWVKPTNIKVWIFDIFHVDI